MDYYKAYIHKPEEDTIETISTYGIYLKSIPYRPFGEVKDIPSNDWYDEDGDDEYIPKELKMKAFELETEWAFKTCTIGGKKMTASKAIRDFVQKLMSLGEFNFSENYNGITYQSVRFMKLADDAEIFRDADGEIFIFKITLKVNNPNTLVFDYFDNGTDEEEAGEDEEEGVE